jgi:hypothetical protein
MDDTFTLPGLVIWMARGTFDFLPLKHALSITEQGVKVKTQWRERLQESTGEKFQNLV